MESEGEEYYSESDCDTDYYSDEEQNDLSAYWLSPRVLGQRVMNSKIF